MSTLCGVAGSWLSKSTVKLFPAGAARQFVSNAMPLATTLIVVPFGLQLADGAGAGVPVGWGGGEKARASPDAAGVATWRFPLAESYQARASDAGSDPTARDGVTPARLSGTGTVASCPPWPEASWTRFCFVSAHVTYSPPLPSTPVPVVHRASPPPPVAGAVEATSATCHEDPLPVARWTPPPES